MTYKIIRFYSNRMWRSKSEGSRAKTIKKGLTLEEAQAHCNDPETSADTCKKPENVNRTARVGFWFDGYTAE